MHWKVKAAAAQVMSRAPGGRALHQFVQRRVTRSLPMPEPDFRTRLGAALRHLELYARFATTPLAATTHYEFGAGWDLAVPLAFRAAGVPRQHLLDLDPLARAEYVAVSNARVRAAAMSQSALSPDRLPKQGPVSQRDLAPWLQALGIRYRAPADARDTGLPEGSVDWATSTATLEHIPEADIARILRETHRILAPGGLMTCQVDMSDHFAHADGTLSPYHFLSLDERTWSLVNAPLIYQNRLRASVHVALAEQAGFEVVEALHEYPPDVDPDRTTLPPVHESFTRWRDKRDLLAVRLWLVCRKAR